MGFRRGKRKGWKKKSRDNASNNGGRGNYERFGSDERFPSWQTNRRMEAYYAYQGLHNKCWDDEKQCYRDCQTDEEKTQEAVRWMETIKRELPASFRIGIDTDPIIRESLEKEIHDMVGKEMEIKLEGDDKPAVKIIPSKRIPFVPNAYQLAVSRRAIRRNPSLKPLFEWLRTQTDAGFVSRQETVSMIPPVVLDVESHHQVLDMCAAPGSKTGQIFEIVSRIAPGQTEPTGCVVANDSDHKRAFMLTHQLKRIPSPAALITSCDAQFFPMLWKKDQEGMFDRVLADVPCSGDGTMRKNPMVWKNWSTLNSYGLHPLQLALAINGARLTKVGGYLCYSTCAVNPIENEAVVAELIRCTDGALEIVDRRAELKGMKARDGWSSWKVMKEMKSKRQVANERKKMNEKMQERRQQFAEHGEKIWEKKDAKDEKANGEETTSKENNNTESEDVEDKKMNGEETISKEDNNAESKENAPAEGENTASEETTSKENNNNTESKENASAVEGENTTLEDKKKSESSKQTEKKEGSKILPLGPPPDWNISTLKARCDDEGYIEYKSFEEVEEIDRYKIRRSCFPPTPEEAATMKLEKCLRFLPHDMDTSGFFVTLLKKVKPLSAKAKDRAQRLVQQIRNDIVDDEPSKKKAKPNEEKAVEKAKLDSTTAEPDNVKAVTDEKKPAQQTKSDTDEEKAAKKAKLDSKTAEPDNAKAVTDDKDEKKPAQQTKSDADEDGNNMPPSKKVKLDNEKDVTKEERIMPAKTKVNNKSRGSNCGHDDYVHVSESVLDPLIEYYGFTKDFPKDQFMARMSSASKSSCKMLYFVGKAVKRFMDGGLQDRIMVVNTGLRAFERNAKECDVSYRVTQEGIHYLVPYMTTRKITIDIEDFVKCIQLDGIKIELFSSEFAEQARKFSVGSFAVILRGYEKDYSKKMMMVMWKCRGDHLNCLVSKIEKLGMKSKLRACFPDKELAFANDEDSVRKKWDGGDKKDGGNEESKPGDTKTDEGGSEAKPDVEMEDKKSDGGDTKEVEEANKESKPEDANKESKPEDANKESKPEDAKTAGSEAKPDVEMEDNK